MKLLIAFLLAGLSLVAEDTRHDLPLAILPSPDGKFALVLDSGTSPGISVRDIASPEKEISRLALPDAWLGLTFARDKKTVYAGGGSRGSVFELALAESGELKLVREMKASDFVGDVQLSPDGRLIYAADVFSNIIAVINPQSGRVIDRFKTGRRPYRIVFHPDGKSYFVSSWADAAVYQYNSVNGTEIGRIRLGPHTTDMVLSDYRPVEDGADPPEWKYRLFVAASNTNSVYAVGIGDNKSMTLIDTINVAPEKDSPLGMTPSALALSADQKELYVVCSDAGTVAKVDVSEGHGVVDGFAPLPSSKQYALAVHTSPSGIVLATFKGSDTVAATPSEMFQSVAQVLQARMGGDVWSPRDVDHVIYIIPQSEPIEVMRAVGGTASDFAVKLSRHAKFDLGDPANLPPAGYLWTNAMAAGMSVQNYGVMMKNGQAIDPPMRPYSEADIKTFFEDLKQGEASNDMPRLILMQIPDKAAQGAVFQAIAKSRFAASTEIVIGELSHAEALLKLKPMTRQDVLQQEFVRYTYR